MYALSQSGIRYLIAPLLGVDSDEWNLGSWATRILLMRKEESMYSAHTVELGEMRRG